MKTRKKLKKKECQKIKKEKKEVICKGKKRFSFIGLGRKNLLSPSTRLKSNIFLKIKKCTNQIDHTVKPYEARVWVQVRLD